MMLTEKVLHVSQCLQLAILLEVSTNKPGNVNFTDGFEGTRAEHFLASAVATIPSFVKAASNGENSVENKNDMSRIEIGRIIKECISDIASWQSGGNTLLGTVMLFVPLAAAAGASKMNGNSGFDLFEVRKNLEKVVDSAGPQDTVDLYDAIRIANPSGLKKVGKFDATDSDSKEQIRKEAVPFRRVFEISADRDDISFELANNYQITFEESYPYLSEQLQTGKSLQISVVNTFLKILSKHPDTLISRKVGKEKAQKTSKMANAILGLGGFESSSGKAQINKLDEMLRSSGNLLNPGTTADLTAAALGLCILDGYRP